jgi:hypothetical protein
MGEAPSSTENTPFDTDTLTELVGSLPFTLVLSFDHTLAVPERIANFMLAGPLYGLPLDWSCP